MCSASGRYLAVDLATQHDRAAFDILDARIAEAAPGSEALDILLHARLELSRIFRE